MTLLTAPSPLSPGLPSAEARLGDPGSWVDTHGDILYRFAFARVGDATVAEDLVQETLLSGWQSRHSFTGDCQPRTWLIAILKRRVADHFRRSGRRVPCVADQEQIDRTLTETVDSPASDRLEAAEFWSVVTGCTGDLPDHLARAFRLRAFGDDAPDAICDSEGISRKNLSVRLCRARTLLRQCLEKRWFGDSPKKEPRR